MSLENSVECEYLGLEFTKVVDTTTITLTWGAGKVGVQEHRTKFIRQRRITGLEDEKESIHVAGTVKR